MPKPSVLASIMSTLTTVQPRSKATKLLNFEENKKFKSFYRNNSPVKAANYLNLSNKIAMKLQFIHGLRFSDLQNITHKDVLSCGIILVKTAKGNNPRILYFPDILQITSTAPINADFPVFRFSYHQYYSAVKRAGFYKYLRPGAKKLTVTHLFRHNRITEIIKLLEPTNSTLINYTGHKNARSISFYDHSKES